MGDPHSSRSRAGGLERSTLVEREADAATLGATLTAATQGLGRVATVRGPAGIGKTALLDQAACDAAGAGLRVLRARGDDLEEDFAFGLALQLLEPVLADEGARDDLFDGPAERARPLLESGGDELPDGEALHATLRGLSWVVWNLAERQPIAIVVDDAHWADLASLQWLRYVARRVDDQPVSLVVGTRPVATGGRAPLLVSLAGAGALVEPAALSECGIADLVRSEGGAIDAESVVRWRDLTGGVPLYVHELLRVGAGQEGGGTAVDESLTTVLARLDRLSEPARRLAEAAAILGERTPLWQATRLAAVEDPDRSRHRELVDAALLRPVDDVAFTHPMVREAVERSIPEVAAHALHRAAAAQLDAALAAPERIAHHLMAAPPSGAERDVEVLELAARRARALGSATQAVQWLRRAAADARAEVVRRRVVAELVVAEAMAGDAAWSSTLPRVLRDLPAGTARALARQRVARALAYTGQLQAASRVYRQALDDPDGPPDGEVRLQLLSGLAMATRIDVGRRTSLEPEIQQALEGVDPDESRPARALLATLAYDRSLAGASMEETRDLARQAILHPAVDDDEVSTNVAYHQALLALLFADDADGVEAAVARALAVAELRSDELLFASSSNGRAALRFVQGRIDDALADATAAVEVLSRNRHFTLPGALGNLALARVELGEADDAVHGLELPDGEARWHRSASYSYWLYCRAVLRLETGQPGAVEDLEAVLARQRALGAHNPATIPAPFVLAEVLAAAGDTDGAAAVLGPAEAVAEQFGSARSRAAAARVRAAIEPSDAVRHLEHAVAIIADTPWGLERIRSRIALGRALLDRGDAAGAREPLRLALAEADAGGATRLADATRDVLLATGARPRRSAVAGPASLTPTERAVAQLACDGLTNRAIAARRFVSVKAVEFQLANAYRKLGIGSRAELPDALRT